MSGFKWWALSAGALWLAASGCTCGEPPNTIPSAMCSAEQKSCETDDQCPERHVCKTNKTSGARCCERSYRKCSDEAGCCPGQVCTSEGRCVDKFDECAVDTDCGETGDRVCEEWVDPVLGATKRCTFRRCDANGACPSGQVCFASFCVASPPCNGECPAGSACVPQNNRCHPYGTRCNLPPKPGYMVVFSKSENVYDVCLMADVACEYAELPPLASFDLGKHASIAATDGRVVVAQYDGTYGDLVVTDFDPSGAALKSTWVDGVPTGKAIIAAPSGPRGGVGEPGDDVGRYADIAAKADGTVYVTYYDQTNGDLRFAERGAGGTWNAYRVDGEAADLGLFTSLTLDAEGKPAVAYFQRGGSDDPSVSCPSEPGADKALITALKLARARVEHPASAADWDIELVSCAARPPPPCYGCTIPGARICAQNPDTTVGGTLCAKPSTGCSPACATGEVCIESGAASACAAQGSPAEVIGVPLGRGLFPSLAFKGGTPVIAYYDSVKGNLVVAQKASSWTTVTLDGEDAKGDTGDVGLYPTLAIGSDGTFNIAYHDWTRRGLRYCSGMTLVPVSGQRKPSAASFVDKGLSPPNLDGPSWVGADVALAMTSFGTFAVYQNSTASDLRLAKRENNTWKPAKEWTEGAVGFFADAAELNGKLYIVHTRLHAKVVGGKAVPDNGLKLEIFSP